MSKVDEIAARVATHYDVPVPILYGITRRANHLAARYAFWVALYTEAGMSRVEIANLMNRSGGSIDQVIRFYSRERGFGLHDTSTEFTQKRKKDLTRLIKEGASNKEIVEKTGYTYGSVRTLRWKLGLEDQELTKTNAN